MTSLQGNSPASASILQNAVQQQQQQQSQQQACSSAAGASNSNHLAKIEANHNRRAMHRRTQSQFEFKNCSSSTSSNTTTAYGKNQIQNVTGNAVENNSIFIPNQQQQCQLNNNGLQQSNLSPTSMYQQQQQQMLQLNQGNINVSVQQQQQQQCQLLQLNQLQQQQQLQSSQPQLQQQLQIQQQLQYQQPQQVAQSSQVSPADSLQQMIQLMQAKQQQSGRIQQQIVEPIEQDFMKFQSQNSGFNFGKKIHRLYPSSQMQLAAQQLEQAKYNDTQQQQQQIQLQQQQQQSSLSSSSSPQAYGMVSPFHLPNTSSSPSSNSSFFNNSGQLMHSPVGLQPIPEQNDGTSGDYAMLVSHPSSTRNMSNPEEAKKQSTHFHSHSNSLTSNPTINNNPSSPSQQLGISPSSSHPSLQFFHRQTANTPQLFFNSLGPTTAGTSTPGQSQQLQQVGNQATHTHEDKEFKVSSARDHYSSGETQIASLTSTTPKVTSSFGLANAASDKKFFSSAKKQEQTLLVKQLPQQQVIQQQQLVSSSPSKQSPRQQQNIAAVVVQQTSSNSTCSSAVQTQQQQQHVSRHKKNSSLSDKDLDQSMKAIQAQWLQVQKFDKLKQQQSTQQSSNSIVKDSNNSNAATVPLGYGKTNSSGIKNRPADGESTTISNNNNNNKFFQAGQIAYVNGKTLKKQQTTQQTKTTITSPAQQTALTRSYTSVSQIQQLSNSSLSVTQQQQHQQTHMHSVSSQQLHSQQLHSSQILQPTQGGNTTLHKRKTSAANSSTIQGQQQQQQQQQPYLFQHSPQVHTQHQQLQIQSNLNESTSTAGLVLNNKFNKSSQSTGQLGQQQQQKTFNATVSNSKSIVHINNDMNAQHNNNNRIICASNSSRSEQDQTKICQLESIVFELHERMHKLEETNSFLIHKIKNLLEEKQSDKKIRVIEDQTKLNNDHISAIRKLIAANSSSLQVKQESSTHIFTDMSENESPQADSQQCLLPAKDNPFDQFQSLMSPLFIKSLSEQQQQTITYNNNTSASNCLKIEQLRQTLPAFFTNNSETNEVSPSSFVMRNQLKPQSAVNKSTPQLSLAVQQSQKDQQKNQKHHQQQQQQRHHLNS